MKKGTSNLHQSPTCELAKARRDTQIFLNQYLERQKELVSKKRKLKTLKQKRDSLLAQVKFLRRRRRYLLKHQSSNSQCSSVDRSLKGKRNDAPHEAAVGKNSILALGHSWRGRAEEGETVQSIECREESRKFLN